MFRIRRIFENVRFHPSSRRNARSGLRERHFPAVLILGPTGSGKTPLGRELETRGLIGRRCRHFDFGAEMRALTAHDPEGVLTEAETSVVRRSLSEGALLEDKEFPLAEKILRNFLHRKRGGRNDILVLNGLPRHLAQAERMDAIVDVRVVVLLECDSENAKQRIQKDSGGDRKGREDADPRAVVRRLADYRNRTRPLAAYYADRGAPWVRVPVGTHDSGAAIYTRLMEDRDFLRTALK